MGRIVLGMIAAVVGLVLVGVIAIKLLAAVFSLGIYLIVGALVVGGGIYLYGRAKRAVGPGTRTRNRIDAAATTYRQRNR